MNTRNSTSKSAETARLRDQFTRYVIISDRIKRLTMKVPLLLRRLIKKEGKERSVTMGRVLSETLCWVDVALAHEGVNPAQILVQPLDQTVSLSTYVSHECFINFQQVARSNGLYYKDLMNALLCKRYGIFDDDENQI